MNYMQVKKVILWSVLLGVTSFLGISCILNNHEDQESLKTGIQHVKQILKDMSEEGISIEGIINENNIGI